MDLYLHTPADSNQQPAHNYGFAVCSAFAHLLLGIERTLRPLMRWVRITYNPVCGRTRFIRLRRNIFCTCNPTIYFQPTESFSLSTNCTIFSLSTRHPLRPRHNTRSHISSSSSSSSPPWHFFGERETSWRISHPTPSHRSLVWLLFRFVIFLSCRVAAFRLLSLPTCNFIVEKLNECYFASYRAQVTFMMTATPRIPFLVAPEAPSRTHFKWTQWIHFWRWNYFLFFRPCFQL